jgi:glc operon protein GlcG
MLNLPEATPIQGGLPLLHQGQIVGGIGVSGVLSPQDEEIARAGVEALG